MPDRRGAGYDSPDWAIRTAAFHFHLSTERPFTVRHLRHPRPTSTAVSIHDGMEVGMVLTGGLEVRLDDRVVPGDPGDVWLIEMWEPHRWRVTKPRTQQLSVIFLPEFVGEQALGEMPWLSMFSCPPRHRPLVTTPETRRSARAIGAELSREAREMRPGWTIAVRLAIIRLLFALGRNWEPPPLAHVSPRRPGALARIMPALEAVHARPASRVTLTQAAHACGLSGAQFNRVFQQVMGVSFARYRMRCRLAYAAHLLRATGAAMDVVAAQAGFADASHLHRCFTRQYGVTPGRYREGIE
jgi:AraC-like DNA-binding protein